MAKFGVICNHFSLSKHIYISQEYLSYVCNKGSWCQIAIVTLTPIQVPILRLSSYSASVVKIYSATNSMACFYDKNIFLYKNAL
jgi:hypothetical protein